MSKTTSTDPPKRPKGKTPTPTIQQYLEWIYYLHAEEEEVIAARLAERLGVSAPTVHATLGRLTRDAWVRLDERKRIELTDRGRRTAEEIIRRHRLAERFLTDILGFEWSRAHEEASRMEHAISGEVGERLSRFLNHPPTCPHGNPIPGNWQGATDPMMPLSELKPGSEVIVRRITEDAEQDPELLAYLEESGIVPGERWTLVSRSPTSIGLERNGRKVSLTPQRAGWVRVSAAPEQPH